MTLLINTFRIALRMLWPRTCKTCNYEWHRNDRKKLLLFTRDPKLIALVESYWSEEHA